MPTWSWRRSTYWGEMTRAGQGDAEIAAVKREYADAVAAQNATRARKRNMQRADIQRRLAERGSGTTGRLEHHHQGSTT